MLVQVARLQIFIASRGLLQSMCHGRFISSHKHTKFQSKTTTTCSCCFLSLKQIIICNPRIMGGNGAKRSDFYQVLGLNKECTEAELKTAYKKLALKWHPDRFSASGNSKYVEEAKTKFQAIQEAYSVLSDVNKRFMYDVGAYDSDDDQHGMADFMSEMAVLMSQNKPNGNGESFEELKDLFEELFESDIESESHYSSLYSSFGESSSSSSSNKRGSSAMSNTKDSRFQGFPLGARRETTIGGRGDMPEEL